MLGDVDPTQCADNAAADAMGFDEPYPGIDCTSLVTTTPTTTVNYIPLGVTGSPAPSNNLSLMLLGAMVLAVMALAGSRGERSWD